MSYIHTTDPAQATDEVADLYHHLRGNSGVLPNYARVFSHRPALVTAWSELQGQIRAQLEDRTYLLANLAAALASRSSYCALAFANRLLARHFSEDELLAALQGGDHSPLSRAEQAAWDLASQVATGASAVAEEHVQALRAAGCSDSTIFDIVAAAAARCFFARIPDALGVQADAHYHDMSPALRRWLVVGRPIESITQRTTADPAGQR